MRKNIIFLLMVFVFSDYSMSSKNKDLFEAVKANQAARVMQLLNEGVDINVQNAFFFTPLMIAVSWGFKPMAELLINQGAQINAGPSTTSALIIAVGNKDKAMIELLISRGANVNAKTASGRTPLMNAAKDNNREMVELLLRYDADIDIQNDEKKTAIDLAASPEIKKILVDAKLARDISKLINNLEIIKSSF